MSEPQWMSLWREMVASIEKPHFPELAKHVRFLEADLAALREEREKLHADLIGQEHLLGTKVEVLTAERDLLREQLECAVEALQSIGALGVKDFEEKLPRLSRGQLIETIDHDTELSRQVLNQISAMAGEKKE